MTADPMAVPPACNYDLRRGIRPLWGETLRHASAGLRWPVRRSIRQPVMKTLGRAALAAFFLLAGIAGASAHPHVWVIAKSELVYSPDGKLKEIRHAWTFDDMFSAFAAQGLDTNNDGKLSREELADLAKTNVESLKEFGYFTVEQEGRKAARIRGAGRLLARGGRQGHSDAAFYLADQERGAEGRSYARGLRSDLFRCLFPRRGKARFARRRARGMRGRNEGPR